MRCPKCGYISFDHLEICLKCKKNIKVASDALQGGVLNVAVPVFLNLQAQADQSDEYDSLSEDDAMVGDFDLVVDEESVEEAEDEIALDLGQGDGEERESGDIDVSLDEETEQEIAVDLSDNDEISIDPSLFDDDSEFQGRDFEIKMPEDLVDMSDLAPPVSSEDIKVELDSPDESDSLSIDLDGLDFDLDSDTPASYKSTKSAVREEDALSLGDIVLSDIASEPRKKENKKSVTMDMDDDLDFDLDLGDLSIHDDIRK